MKEIFIIVWSIGIGAIGMWIMKELTKNEKRKDDE